MATTIDTRSAVSRTRAPGWLVGPALVLGGIAFSVGGAMHPSDSGHGNKVQQLHDMLVSSSWYPAHAALLAAMAFFAAALYALRQRRDLAAGLQGLVTLVFVTACIATVFMVVHLLAALGAHSVAGGKQSLLVRVQTINETVDAVWGIALATLAVAAGMTRVVGNRIVMLFGLVGGLAFALASATIPYTDTFDSVFRVGSLLSVWAIVVGVFAIRRERSRSSRLTDE